MINISEATAIGLHVMIYIANRKGEIVPLKEIAKVFSISENHLSKVLQRLMDIYEAIEGKYIRKDCLFSSRHITSCCCIMKPLISSINNTFEEFMKNNSISNLKL